VKSNGGEESITTYRLPDDGRSWAYKLEAGGEELPVTPLPGIDAAECSRVAAEYGKLPAYCRIEPKHASVHYSHLASAGELDVEIIASEAIQTFTIHPERRGIRATADGNVLRFTIDDRQPRYFVLEVNDLSTYCLIVDPPEVDAPSIEDRDVVNAGRFLADATGKTDQTEAFAEAIAAVNGTGKTLFVPPGVYLTGTVRIHAQ
jgi:hypothetical protein